VAVTLTNSLEGVTPSGTVLTAGAGGNTGGASGNFFDVVNIGTGATNASDSAQAAHGSLSLKLATGSTAGTVYVTWSTSLTSTTLTVVYQRISLFATANPAANSRLLYWGNSGATIAASLRLNTAGTLAFQNSANSVILTSTATIPLNAWCRIEAMCNSATGVAEFKLFNTPDSATPTETQTSTSGQSLSTDCGLVRIGQSGGAQANYGPYWLDDLGASDTAYLGPAVVPALLPQQIRMRRPALVTRLGAAHKGAIYGR